MLYHSAHDIDIQTDKHLAASEGSMNQQQAAANQPVETRPFLFTKHEVRAYYANSGEHRTTLLASQPRQKARSCGT